MTDTTSPTAVVRANDAANRGVRTLVQGLVVDIVIAVAGTLLTVLAGAPSEITWTVIGISVGKSALTAVLSYVMRIRDDLPGLLTPITPVLATTIVNTVTADRPGEHARDRTEADRAAAADRPADPTL